MLAAKGLRGMLKIEVLTDWPERLAVGRSVFLEGEDRSRSIREVELRGRAMALRVDGIESREAAISCVGRYLEVEPRDLPAGSYYWHQLIGVRVEDPAGRPLGTLVEVFRAGENEVYRITDGTRETLVPALRSVVKVIDQAAGRMVVSLDTEEVR